MALQDLLTPGSSAFMAEKKWGMERNIPFLNHWPHHGEGRGIQETHRAPLVHIFPCKTAVQQVSPFRLVLMTLSSLAAIFLLRESGTRLAIRQVAENALLWLQFSICMALVAPTHCHVSEGMGSPLPRLLAHLKVAIVNI